ncbi:RNA-binding protein 33-like [Diadema setosum]|uniref:RNA-binding protein 33-like n=1 Tax=Diadema setosum TaxID=31175 RepID=UPI003B3B99D7
MDGWSHFQGSGGGPPPTRGKQRTIIPPGSHPMGGGRGRGGRGGGRGGGGRGGRGGGRGGGGGGCVSVAITGLAASTTKESINHMLHSVGPIKNLQFMGQQRKAIATFTNPQHAQLFQLKFHRHLIDLAHINVMVI